MVPQVTKYHHGDLRATLIRVALDVARREGPGGIKLREVTHRVGVTPNAAYRHFPDLDALVLAAALEAQAGLADAMTARMARMPATDDPRERAIEHLRCVGLGYIDFAIGEPGWFELALVTFDPRASGPATVTVGGEVPLPFRLLINALDGMVDAAAMTDEQRQHAEWPCWSAVHGFADLVARGPLKTQDREVLNQLARHVVDSAIAGITAVPTSPE